MSPYEVAFWSAYANLEHGWDGQPDLSVFRAGFANGWSAGMSKGVEISTPTSQAKEKENKNEQV